jgi:putative NADPH-quinone reductase
VLKGWLERVLVPGVAFVLDEQTNRVRPGLGQLRWLIGISTYGSSRRYTWVFGDTGRRVITRGVRLLAPRRGRRTKWIPLYGVDASRPAARAAFVTRVERAMAGL